MGLNSRKCEGKAISASKEHKSKTSKSQRVITIRDVAEATGFSVATVSLVLNKAARRIPPTTQRLVEEMAAKMGYFPNLQARSLRSRRTHSIGVLVFDITDPYCALILRGLEDSLSNAGFMSIFADLQNQPDRLRQSVQMLVERRVEGLIAIADPFHLGSDLAGAIAQFNLRAVVIGSESADKKYGSVMVDDHAGTWDAMEHLYSLGHRQIAVIKGPVGVGVSAARWQGIRKYAQAKGISIHPALVVEVQKTNSTVEEGYLRTRELLKKKKPFTALVAFDDITAFGAIGALASSGIRVPEDCSVIGFDDLPASAYYNPPLTTIGQYMEKQSEIGAAMMLALLENEGKTASHEKIKPTLVVRKSTMRVPSRSS